MKTAFKNYLHELTKVQHVFLTVGKGKEQVASTSSFHFLKTMK